MKTQIATKLQLLAERVDEPLPVTKNHYVIAKDLMDALSREDVLASIKALFDAGIARLPFPELMVEFHAIDQVTSFVWLQEIEGGISIKGAMMAENICIAPPEEPLILKIDGAKFSIDHKHLERDRLAGILAVQLAMLMLNIRGIEKQFIEPTNLNRQRKQRNLPAVPNHTVLRIGVVYGRNGEKVSGGGGKLRKVHLRAGHTRNQAFGPGRQDHKLIYIEPMLVNYRDGDEVPSVNRIIKMGTKTAA